MQSPKTGMRTGYWLALTALLLLVVSVQAASNRGKCQNNLQQIGLAILHYHEIHKTLEFFRSTTGGSAVDRLFVCGGGSLLAGLLDRLRQHLDIRTIPLDPFRLLGGAAADTAGHRHRRVAAVAVGLALRQERYR